MYQDEGILLESGTNELEIVEFEIGENRFGINVIKVKEILNPQPITKIPHSHPSVEGIMEIRGEIVPVLDVADALGFEPSANPKQDKFILTEFNQTKIAFHVHTVTRIHRVSWKNIEKPNKMYQGLEGQITGVIKMNEGMLLLLDFEKVVADINPESSLHKDQLRELGERERSQKKILIAEDSPMLRGMLQETLHEAGYEHTVSFENGKEIYDHLEGISAEGKVVEDEYQLIITDIEMPQLDGHHLTRLIKEDERFQSLPVVIFSSLITEDLRHKGEMVGADAQVSKPEIVELVKIIDQHILS
ncbi:chemotaxis protein [Halobacillus litoralis]|uniref:chemotaxis protein n=1 Tax=Halobacillus litoralis TaxID=45668 RepID=UPI0021F5F392|nr:chemotaxis protein [Halobacillus litoralis]